MNEVVSAETKFNKNKKSMNNFSFERFGFEAFLRLKFSTSCDKGEK